MEELIISLDSLSKENTCAYMLLWMGFLTQSDSNLTRVILESDSSQNFDSIGLIEKPSCSSWEYLRLKMQRYVAMSFIHYILATLKLFTTLILLPTDRMRKRTQRRPISLARKPKRGVTRGISPLLTITDSRHTLLSE